ncbi:MAG: P27 family phage terminase small subunit [Alphaproteobacteria bacterium]|nr:P27 family phage terminase small subunit [Alphaproteobacteria bacterium]
MPRPVGRPPKPTALHVLHGTLRKSRHRHRQNEPQPEGDLATVQPPAQLSETQQEIWRRIVAESPRGVLRGCDELIVTLFAVNLDLFLEANRVQNQVDAGLTHKFLAKDGALSPYLRVQRHAASILTSLIPELGFSPASRPRLAAPGEMRPESDRPSASPFARFSVVPGGKKT